MEFESFILKNKLQEKVIYIDHHECHAIGAFICSSFQKSLVITCDGRGDFQSFTVSLFTNSGFEVLQRETSIDSLGYFYS
ncbi:hypothetical protein JCM31447_24490 [Fluviispira sanaruensis]|uniref:Carbamoyltransferase domain-containing protein n=1 Tax=Fluviispira sanaruensis TaxID=2493639 RepID=A0A4P2VWK4_FLUSA|nr:hypothetical protein JCM31447_24490 [Fluviispira sanaruensis]